MSNLDHSLRIPLMPPWRRTRSRVVRRTMLCLMLASVDGVLTALSLIVVALAYHSIFLNQTFADFDSLLYARYALLAGLFSGTFAAVAYGRFLNDIRPSRTGLQDSIFGWTAAVAMTLLIAFLAGEIGDLSRVSLTAGYVLGLPVAVIVRGIAQSVVTARISRGELHFDSVSVIGNRIDVLNFLLDGELWVHGHKLTNTLYLEDVRNENGVVQHDAVTRFAAASVRAGTDRIVFVGTLADLDELEDLLSQLKRFAINILYAPAIRTRSLKFLDVVSIGPNNVLRFLRTPMSDAAVILKRGFDIALSCLGLIALLPLFLVIAAAIKLESTGPVIFRQARMGFNGEPFMIWKFRSMSVTENGYEMHQAQKADPRITRVGAFLRRTSIDELPQLVNVLRGQMSLVGPRPHAISHDEELSRRVASYAHRQRIKPGITGWAQVNGFRGDTSNHDQIEGRVLHDIYYIENWSIYLDLWTLALTVFSPASRRNAH